MAAPRTGALPPPMGNRVKSTMVEPSIETIEIHHTTRCRGLPAPLLRSIHRPPIVLGDRDIKYVQEFGEVLQEVGVRLQTVSFRSTNTPLPAAAVASDSHDYWDVDLVAFRISYPSRCSQTVDDSGWIKLCYPALDRMKLMNFYGSDCSASFF